MTAQATFCLSAESLGFLRSLKGRSWRLATGKPSPEKPGHHFSWDNVIVATDGGDARIHTELVESEFEGYGEEYAQLSVHSDSQGLAEAQRDRRGCFEHAGARITEVFLMRISITQMMHGEPTWTYSGDYGVIFGLTEGAAAVCKTGHHTDALDVFFADSVGELEIDDRFDEWDVANEPGEEYEWADRNSGTNLGPHVLRAPKRPARLCTICEPRLTRISRVSRYNVLDPFPGGQVVAGSNPVSKSGALRCPSVGTENVGGGVASAGG
jgi:hypothetical protein